MSNPLRTASGIPLFRTSTPTASRPSRPEPLATEPTGDLHLVGSVKTLPDGRFEIRSQYDPRASGFFHALPESRWVPNQQVWRCLATPLCGWMLRSVGLVLDGECQQMADKWDEAVSEPSRGSVDTGKLLLKTQLRSHQVASLEFAARKYGVLFAHGMGGGKSLTAIATMQMWGCRSVLVICPKAVLGVWRREMDKHCNLSQNVVILDDNGTEAKAKKVIDAKRHVNRFAVTMIVVNYESSWRKGLAEHLIDFGFDLLVADEGHKLGDNKSSQSVLCQKIADQCRYRMVLTGTPMENRLGIFGIYRILEPALFGTSFTRFRSRYAVCHDQFKNKVLSYLNSDEFIGKYKKLAFRVETLDVWDLPKLSMIDIPVTLTAKTMQVYKTLKKQALVEIESGEVTVANAGVKLIRLTTITSGHLKTDEGKVTRIGSEKREALKELLESVSANDPFVVFCRFTEDLLQVSEIAKELGRRYHEVSGSRKDISQHATMLPDTQILGVQERAGGVGIDLTGAQYACFFSHGMSLKDRQQAYARLHRPGATKPVFIYSLIADGTVDEVLVRALNDKADAVDEVLKHIRWSK